MTSGRQFSFMRSFPLMRGNAVPLVKILDVGLKLKKRIRKTGNQLLRGPRIPQALPEFFGKIAAQIARAVQKLPPQCR